MITYPNQKIVHINKGNFEGAYLSIGIDEWIEASKNLTPNTFKLYLYLCSNKDGFDLALSRQDVMNKLGISKDSYVRGVKELTDKNYLSKKSGNVYDFNVSPTSAMYAAKHVCTDATSMYAVTHTSCMQPCTHTVCTDATDMYAAAHTEINKISKTNNLSNIRELPEAAAPQEEKREIKDLSDEELKSLKRDFTNEVKYQVLYEKYNLSKGQLDKNLLTKIDTVLSDRIQDKKKEKIRKNLSTETKEQLLKLMNVRENDLVKYISSLKVNASPEDIIRFLGEHTIFTHEEWITKYAHRDEYKNLTYFDWFVDGFNMNFKCA